MTTQIGDNSVFELSVLSLIVASFLIQRDALPVRFRGRLKAIGSLGSRQRVLPKLGMRQEAPS
jgi:hypothetical protein